MVATYRATETAQEEEAVVEVVVQPESDLSAKSGEVMS